VAGQKKTTGFQYAFLAPGTGIVREDLAWQIGSKRSDHSLIGLPHEDARGEN